MGLVSSSSNVAWPGLLHLDLTLCALCFAKLLHAAVCCAIGRLQHFRQLGQLLMYLAGTGVSEGSVSALEMGCDCILLVHVAVSPVESSVCSRCVGCVMC